MKKTISLMIFSIIKKLLIFSFLLPIIVFANTKEKVKFVKCVDGDTAKFERNNKVFTLRFLAVNTPETKSPKKGVEFYGKEASNYTCKRLQEAKTIEIEYDNKSERKDRYGRNLGWVFLDDKLLQKDLVENGYAKVDYIYDKYKYVEELKEIDYDFNLEKSEVLIDIISDVRGYKTVNNVSLKTIINNFEISCSDEIKKNIEDALKDFKATLTIENIKFNIIDSSYKIENIELETE